ncbi:putative baseplate wedge subunit [Escherichia phage EP75]|uniref:Putative baseplate wedge subunit n=1 Tax=Escherichia phage EP75 TaxID=2070200 RepID=A0A2Z3DNP9_9CAUD|nr:putative baseplate wedge subunit [Escherichia phage EP75]AVZ45051.1 putative baseplate wedge subunit [Escherichia phage EP75]
MEIIMATQTVPSLDVRAFEYIIKQRMKADPTFKDYDFEGSGLSAIIRLLASDANAIAFMQNMLNGEGHLKTANQRSNVGLSAAFLSYTPDNYRAAYMYVNIKVTPYDASTAPNEIIMDRRVMFVGAKDGSSYNFTVEKPVSATLTADGYYMFNNVKLVQGNWLYKTYDVEGSAISTYTIPSGNVDINHMVVQVQESESSDVSTTYQRYNSPFDLSQYAYLYFVELGIDGLYVFEFGDGYLSRRVEDGNVIFLQYLETSGAEGNDITSLSSASSIGGFNQVDVELVSERSAGGGDPESIEDIKRLAPLAYQADGAAVTETDYGVLTERLFSNVARAKSYGGDTLSPPDSGYVYIAVIPSVGETLSDAEKADIVASLDKYNVGSITPKVVDSDITYIQVATTIFWDPTSTVYVEEQMKVVVGNSIVKWGENNLGGFDQLFDKEILQEAITKMERSINSNITSVGYKRHFKPDYGVLDSFTFSYGRSIKPGSVKITGFKPLPAEVDFTYYMRDENGNLNMYKVNNNDTTKEFLVQKTGVVDYTNGVVDLQQITVSNYNPEGITIVVLPDGLNQNIQASQNQVFKIGDVVVTPEVRYVQRS